MLNQKLIDEKTKEIGGLKKLSLVQDSYFLYDNSNLVRKTYITKLNNYITINGSNLYFNEKKSNGSINNHTKKVAFYQSKSL